MAGGCSAECLAFIKNMGLGRFISSRTTWALRCRIGFPRGAAMEFWPVSDKTVQLLIDTGIPFIDLRGGSKDLGIPMFGPNNQRICTLAFEHLYGRGLRHFAFCGEPTGYHVYDDERKTMFREIVEEHNFECHSFKYRRCKRDANGWEMEQQQFIGWLRSLPKPVGVLACHDDRGQQILDACHRGGLSVPDEIAVIGVDNDEYLSGLSIPSLSSVDTNSQSIGYEAASLLDSVMRNAKKFDHHMLFEPAGVVARQSTDIAACADPEIATAIRFIAQHACHHLTVDDLAQHVPLSRSLLNRRFKQIVGRTPKAEIVRVQLEHAKRLLLDTDLPVSAVCDRSGFSDAKYFIAVFRKSVGQTPRAFRAQHGRFIREE